MVNKKRSTRYTQKNDLEDMNTFLTSENHFLKKKNDDLAKALSDTRLEFQKLIHSSTDLQRKLFDTDVERMNYKETLKAVSLSFQTYISQFITLTEQMATSLKRINVTLKSHDSRNNIININQLSPNLNISKTAAVMPMISGHTISNPTINLPRVSVRQLTEMINVQNDIESDANDLETNEIEFADNISNNEEAASGSSSSNVSNVLINQRLDTMQEEDEEQSLNSSTSLLSGIFKDVKVYISPLSAQHVIQLKGQSSLRRRKSGKNKNIGSTSTLPQMKPSDIQNNSSLNNQTYSASEESITHNNDTNTSIQSEMSNTNNVPDNSTHTTLTNGEEFDPLEGPSSLCNNISSSSLKTPPNETSTPFKVDLQPWRTERSCDESKTPTRSSNFVTRRRSLSSRSKKSSTNSNCTVILERLSPKAMKRLANSKSSNKLKRSSYNRNDSPTVLELSRRSSGQLQNSMVKHANSALSTSPNRRTKRNVKPVSYAEPSLSKKLRQ